MSNLRYPSRGNLRSLAFLGLVLAVLVACGGSEPTPYVLVVTSTFTPEPAVLIVTATYTPQSQVQVVTATFSPAPAVLPSATATATEQPLPPSATPEEIAAVEYSTYNHPSGAFSLDIPKGSDYGEQEEGVYFTYGDSLVMTFFTALEAPMSPAELNDTVKVIQDDALVGGGLISSYRNVEVQGSDEGDAVAATFDMTSDQYGEGQGVIVLLQVEQTVYTMVLLTPDYASVQEVWGKVVDSLRVTPVKPPAPTATPVPPTNTPKPTAAKPKPTATPKQVAPTLPANKGCYLIVNELGADLTITFTAQDWQWNETISIPANGSKEYCLDPGHYTYTLDAPPPWGSTNGDLQVQAGDRYRWPIRGG